MKHYVYKIIDIETGEYYFGSRTNKDPYTDSYMGSMKTWKPTNATKLVKEIIRDNFENREDALEFEAYLIQEHIGDELNRNYYIPDKGFHTVGLDVCSETAFINRYGEIEGIKRRNEWLNNIKNTITKKINDMSDDERRDKFGNAGEKNPRFGKKWTGDWKVEQSNRMKEYYKTHTPPRLGAKHSDDTKSKLSEYKKNYYKDNVNCRKGTKLTEDSILKIINSLKNKPKLTCPHCGITTNNGNAKRWHFDNCKKK